MTYDDFLKELASSGYTLSDYDMALAKSNPDAGIGIIQQKKNWVNATTPEAKQAANDSANQIRTNYGNYSGGSDGSQYNLNTEQTPSSYNLPSYTSEYADQIKSALEAINNTGDYQSQYSDQIKNILSGNYDVTSNPTYQSTLKSNQREASRSAEDALGSAATLTGGMPSSYASTAASQAANYYTSQTADAIPDIIANTLSGLQTQDSTEYQKFIDALGIKRDNLESLQSLDADKRDQFNTEVANLYQQWMDNLDYNKSTKDTADQLDLSKSQLDSSNKELDINTLLSAAGLTGDNSALIAYLKKLGLM